jgi:hypothetical protein
MSGVILLFHLYAFVARTGTTVPDYIYLVDKYEQLASHPGHFTSKKGATGMHRGVNDPLSQSWMWW